MYVLDPVNPNPLMIFFGTVSFFVLAFLFSIPVLLLMLTFTIMLLARFFFAQRLLPKGSWYIIVGCGGISFFIIAALYNDFIRENEALYNGNAWIIVGLGYLMSIMLMIKGFWEGRAVKWQGNSTWKFKEDHQKHYQRCAVCRERLPTKRISFEQNIGLIFVRRGKVLKGSLCKPCINRYFREYTITTLNFGLVGDDFVHLHTNHCGYEHFSVCRGIPCPSDRTTTRNKYFRCSPTALAVTQWKYTEMPKI